MFYKLMEKLKCVPKRHRTGTLLIIAGIVITLCFLPGWALGACSGIILVTIGYCLIQS